MSNPASPLSDTAPPPAQETAAPQSASRDPSEIIVTAQRRSESLERTPVSVAALTSTALQQRGINTEADIQTAVAGVVVKATVSSNELNYAIRGQSIDFGTFSQPAIQPYLNEVPVNGNVASSFYDLESLQVLKGPQGTLFGKNVTGGAVLFTSAKPTNDFGGYFRGRVGNYDLGEVEGALNLPIVKDTVLLRIAGSHFEQDGYTYNLYTQSRLGDSNRNALRGTLLIKPSARLRNTSVVDFNRITGTSVPLVGYSAYAPGQTNNGVPLFATTAVLYSPSLDAAVGLPGAWNTYLAANPRVAPGGLLSFIQQQRSRSPFVADVNYPETTSARSLVISNTTEFDLSSHAKLRNIFGYTHFRSAISIDQDGTPFQIEGTNINRTNEQFSDEFQITGDTFGNRLSYVAGAFYLHELSYNKTVANFFGIAPIIPVTTAAFVSDVTNESISGYGQGTLKLDEIALGLGLTAGLRYTHLTSTETALPGSGFYNFPGLNNVNTLENNKVSWDFGLQDQVTSNLLLYVATRRSFRQGGFNIYAPQVAGLAAAGGNQFLPEIAKDVEVGAKFSGRVGDTRIRANLALYQQWVDNIQRATYVTLPTGIAALTANIPEAQVKGLEFDGQVTKGWFDIGGNLAYTNAKFTKNAITLFGQTNIYGPYPDTPEWSGSAYVQVNIPLARNRGIFSLRADGYAQSKIYFGSQASTVNPGIDVPAYAIANFRVALDNIGGSKLSFAGLIRNAFNKEYFVGGLPTGSVLGVNSVVPGTPRTFWLETRFTF